MRENSWLSVSLFNSQFASFTNNGTQGSQLRSLFVTIITACTPASPEALWNEFRDVLCDDLERRMLREFPTKFPTPERGPSREEVHDYGLFLIESLMNKLDKKLWPMSRECPCVRPIGRCSRAVRTASLMSRGLTTQRSRDDFTM
jgi:hypothetical protein